MDVNQLLNRFTEAQKMMKQMGGMMGLPGRSAQGDEIAEEQAQGQQGRRPAAQRRGAGGGMPGGFPGGMPQLPPGLDPKRAWRAGGLPPGFKLPKLDFNKLNPRSDDKRG